MSAARPGNRSAVWQAIRDAGSAGVGTPKLCAVLQGRIHRNSVYHETKSMADEGFIVRRFVEGVWVVTADCRVPAGESAHLGPGWTGEDADLVGRAQQEAA